MHGYLSIFSIRDICIALGFVIVTRYAIVSRAACSVLQYFSLVRREDRQVTLEAAG